MNRVFALALRKSTAAELSILPRLEQGRGGKAV